MDILQWKVVEIGQIDIKGLKAYKENIPQTKKWSLVGF